MEGGGTFFSSGFSIEVTLVSASAVPHCGLDGAANPRT